MSPIRPENRDRYPADWPIRSLLIRRHRAKWRCECDGRCGHWHRDENAARIAEQVVRQGLHIDIDTALTVASDRCAARHDDPHPVTGSRVILTVAHLDHTPEHSQLGNLMVMCQRCHLHYDRDHHAETRRARLAAERLRAGAHPFPGMTP